jgi:protein-ribulosamine 3-kinase
VSPSEPAFKAIGAQLTAALGVRVEARPAGRVHGGCINDSYRWNGANGPLFVKVAESARRSMLEAEAAGLEELASAAAVRVPRVLAVGAAGEHAYLALEWIDFAVGSSDASQTRLGKELARQHRKTATQFGWHRDNTIGSTPQVNAWSSSWHEFFRDHRLKYQLRLAQDNGFGGRLQQQGAALLDRSGGFFADHHAAPSLLHGDLWGGNVGVDALGTPVIFDPAVYYGDRETDLAMTRLFGGFSSSFYAAYETAWPLPSSARSRIDLYNLYHVLNHLNLFGAGYLRQAESIISRLLSA